MYGQTSRLHAATREQRGIHDRCSVEEVLSGGGPRGYLPNHQDVYYETNCAQYMDRLLGLVRDDKNIESISEASSGRSPP